MGGVLGCESSVFVLRQGDFDGLLCVGVVPDAVLADVVEEVPETLWTFDCSAGRVEKSCPPRCLD